MSDDGLIWPMRSPSTDSFDASELDSGLFSRLQTDMSESPSIMHYSESGSPGPNTEFRMIRKHGNYSRDDDNDSLSSVSTTSSSSALRNRRRPNSINNPSLNGNALHNQSTAQQSAQQSRTAAFRKFNDPDSDYISDGGSVASGESSKAWNGGNSALSRLQQQNEQLKQLQPLVQQQQQETKIAVDKKPAFDATTSSTSTVGNGTVKGPLKAGGTAESPAIRVQPVRTANTARSGPGATTVVTTSLQSTATEVTPVKGDSSQASKPRSTTPTHIPRAVHNTPSSAPNGNHSTAPESAKKSTENGASSAPANRNARDTRPSTSNEVGANASSSSSSRRSASVERGQPVVADTIRSPGLQQRTANVSATIESARGRSRTSSSTTRPSTVESPVPKVAPTNSVNLTNTSQPHSGGSKRPVPVKAKEAETDAYPERGRMRLRSASNPRTSSVERFAGAGGNNLRSSLQPQEPKHSNSPVVRERSVSRGASVSRAPSTSASQQSTPTHTSSTASAATVSNAILAKWNRPIKSVGSSAQAQSTATQKTPSRSSFGSTNTTPKSTVKTPPPTVKGRQPSSAQSTAVVPSPPGRHTTVGSLRSRTPNPTTPGTTGKSTTRVNVTVVSVPHTTVKLVKRNSSSSLSTQGSGSATGSRSSTPTSVSGSSTGTATSRLSRSAPKISPSMQIKSANPYPLRSSSPRTSLEGSPMSPPFSSTNSGDGAWVENRSPSRRRSTDGVSGIPGPSSWNKTINSAPTLRGRNSTGGTGVRPNVASPRGAQSQDYNNGESDQESHSPNSHPPNKFQKLIHPPPEAVPYQPVVIPRRFMQSMAHLGQEAISGVYDSQNYNPCPQHHPRSPKVLASSRFSFRLSDTELSPNNSHHKLTLGSGSPDDADQGSGHTETTQASNSSRDTVDAVQLDLLHHSMPLAVDA